MSKATHTPAAIPAKSIRSPVARSRHHERGVTLVEVMTAMIVLSMVMLGLLSTLLQSRRTTEGAILHAASTSLIYGIVEQLKQLNYDDIPSQEEDDKEVDASGALVVASSRTDPPLFRIQINQDLVKWVQVKYKTHAANAPSSEWWGPLTTPSATAAASTVGGNVAASLPAAAAVDNLISVPLSNSSSGTTSQQLALNLWIWVDEIPDDNATSVKRVTIIYTYTINQGNVIRSVRDREVFVVTSYKKKK